MAVLDALLADLRSTAAPEVVAVLLALAYVVLAVRRSLWCWPSAFASAAIYLVLFARAGLYMQSALQLFYLAMAIYGWIDWRRGRTDAGTLAIESRRLRWHCGVIGVILVATLANGWIVARYESATAPYVDALVTWSSVAATWMVARRLLDNWLYWIVIDLVAAWLYFSQSLTLTGVLFLIYVAIAVRGFAAWRTERERQSTHTRPLDAVDAVDAASVAGHGPD